MKKLLKWFSKLPLLVLIISIVLSVITGILAATNKEYINIAFISFGISGLLIVLALLYSFVKIFEEVEY